MKSKDILNLLLLAMIWGSSFIFIRVLAPVIGPLWTTELRVLIAGVLLVGYLKIARFDFQWSAFWKQYLVIGILNSALPFFLYSFAGVHIPASYSVIINSSSPLFGAVFSYWWLNESLTPKKILGLLLGATGVALVARVGPIVVTTEVSLAIGACLFAAACYALTGIYLKKYCTGIGSRGIAGASQLFAGIAFLPIALTAPVDTQVYTPLIVLNVLGLAILCSAVAYLIYFRLIADVGPTKALTVTFLMPAFGIVWGSLFLDEVVTGSMIFGCALIILGTGFVLNVYPTSFKRCYPRL